MMYITRVEQMEPNMTTQPGMIGSDFYIAAMREFNRKHRQDCRPISMAYVTAARNIMHRDLAFLVAGDRDAWFTD